MKHLVMRDLYAVAAAFPAPHCVNGGAGIWHRAGLESHSRRPKNSPLTKTSASEVALILELRSRRNLGARRIQSELKRLHSISLAMATIHKVLCQNQVKPVVKFRRKADFIRDERPVAGDRVQMDTCKIGPGLCQYTSVDDCTRYRVLRLYSRRTAANTLNFIDCVIEEMPFPIQCFQTDQGREFFVVKVQERLKECGIKFRPNKPASPHLNGKVERSQKTDKAEFYATVDLSTGDLEKLLAEWPHYYNWERPHSAHRVKHRWSATLNVLSKRHTLMPFTQTISPVTSTYRNRMTSLNLS